MITTTIREQIAQNLNMPHSRALIGQRLRQLATNQGVSLDENGIAQLISLLEQYVEGTVGLIEACAVSGEQAGIGSSISPVLQTALQYFLTPNDLLPNHHGLYGLLDDAYLARRLLGQVSELYRQNTGIPLIAIDIHQISGFVRSLLGESVVTQLDQIASGTIQQALMQHQLNTLYSQPAFSFNMQSTSRTGGPGSWGPCFEDEMTRMAAEMGFSINW